MMTMHPAVYGALAVIISTIISLLVSYAIAKKQSKLQYIQTILSNEETLKKFKYFWRRLYILSAFYTIRRNQDRQINQDNRRKLKTVFQYLKERFQDKIKNKEKLKPYEIKVKSFLGDKNYNLLVDGLTLDSKEIRWIEESLEDVFQIFCISFSYSWFVVMFGPAPEYRNKLTSLLKEIAEENNRSQPRFWDQLRLQLSNFLAGNWDSSSKFRRLCRIIEYILNGKLKIKLKRN